MLRKYVFLSFGFTTSMVKLYLFFFFFSIGNMFWIISGYQVLLGYPKNINTLGFPKGVKKIDAVVCNKNTGKTDFFIGDKYWR